MCAWFRMPALPVYYTQGLASLVEPWAAMTDAWFARRLAANLMQVNGQIIGLDGQPLTLWGINWFGFETGTTMVDGLWAGMAQMYLLHTTFHGLACMH